jgi:pimeloyl-ACP methyl ester carboxylesterase
MRTSTRLLLAALLLATTGCFRLDSVLYNPDGSITEYKFNNFDDWEWDYRVPADMVVADSMVHLFTLDSKAPDEASPTKIYANYVGDMARIATDTVILYCHGNASHMDGYWQRQMLLANTGWKHRYGVMALDYRGYGLSEGSPTEAGLYADVDACIRFLADMGLTGDRLVLYGFSMGSAPATELTAHPRSLTPGWLILEAPFASGEQMAQASTGLAMPGSFVTNLKIDNEVEIQSVTQPFLHFHGIEDEFIDYETHGQTVWHNYKGSRGVQVAVEGAGHGDVPWIYGVEPYRAAVLAFLRD